MVQQNTLGVLITGATTTLPMNLSFLIRHINGGGEEINLLVVGFLAFLTPNIVLSVLVLIGGLVSIHAGTKEILEDTKRLELNLNSKACRLWARRFWRSCMC